MKKVLLVVFLLLLNQFALAEEIQSEIVDDSANPTTKIDLTPIEFKKEDTSGIYRLHAEEFVQYGYEESQSDKTVQNGTDGDPLLFNIISRKKDIDDELAFSQIITENSKFTVGSSYKNYYLEPNEQKTTGIFSKFNYKNLSFRTDYLRNSNARSDEYSDKLKFTPAVKLYDRLTLKYIYSHSIQKDTNQSGIGINYQSKFFPDTLEFSADVQRRYANNSTPSNQINFETKIRY